MGFRETAPSPTGCAILARTVITLSPVSSSIKWELYQRSPRRVNDEMVHSASGSHNYCLSQFPFDLLLFIISLSLLRARQQLF